MFLSLIKDLSIKNNDSSYFSSLRAHKKKLHQIQFRFRSRVEDEHLIPLKNGFKRHRWEIKLMKEITYLVRCELQYKPLQNFVIFEYYDVALLVSRSPLRRIDNQGIPLRDFQREKNSYLRVLKLLRQNGTCADDPKLKNNDYKFRKNIGLPKFDNFQNVLVGCDMHLQ